MTGVIKKTVVKQDPSQSFGFIIDEAGVERFFHVSMFTGSVFELVKPGDRVEFEPTLGGKDNAGQRARNVRLV